MTIKQQIEKGSKTDRATVLSVLEQTQIAMAQSGLTLQELIWLFTPKSTEPKN